MKYLFKFCLLIILFSCSQTQSKQNYPPNFIIIFADDLGYGDLSCFGNPIIQTPNLDRLATEGQKWTQFYVADPVCTPSRAGLMTGRYPIRNGMSSDKRVVLFPNSAGGLPQEEVTIAEVLKQKDYATAIIGKWHLGHLPEHLPTTQGFDFYFGIPYSNDMDAEPGAWSENIKNSGDPDYLMKFDQFRTPLMENLEVIERPADQNTITKRYTEKAIEFIKSNKGSPFFLYLPHNMPHIPLFAHSDFLGKSKSGLYGDVIQEIDWSVGQILNTLHEENLDNNTIVVFSSDNGPWLSFKTHGGSAGPLRAGKGTTFEGGQRVPTIFWGPGIVKPGVVHEMGSTLDLINTFAVLSGTEIPSDRKMDGYDLSSVLAGDTKEGPREDFYYWTRGLLHAVRSEQWKLHIHQREPVNYGRVVEMDKPELYNVESDISEKYDNFESKPEIAKKLQQMMDDHLAGIQPVPDNLVKKIGE